MSTESENPRNFRNFLKRIFLRPTGFSLDVQNLSPCRSLAPGEVLLVYFVLLGVVWQYWTGLSDGLLAALSSKKHAMIL